MITVVNRKTYQGPSIYVGRPTSLGNPYRIGVHGTRDEVIAKYRDWLGLNISFDWRVRMMFNDLLRAARLGDVVLSCWCAPLACHADVIKEMLEARL